MSAGAIETGADLLRTAVRLADRVDAAELRVTSRLLSHQEQHGHPDTHRWIHQLRRLASRTGMRELTVRSLLHGAAAGSPADTDAARLLAADVDNPQIAALVAAMGH